MSRLRELVESGEQPILTGEAPTVDGGDLESFRQRIQEMASYVDAMNATDNATARPHASNLAVAIAISLSGVEPILQIAARDKNRLACQSDMVGAALHGIENLCCMTGDDVTAGDEPEAQRVFDVDGPQLVRIATTLAGGHYLSGRPLDPRPTLFVGAVENPGAPPLAHRADRAAKKVAAGARFLQLQICFHAERVEAFVETLDARGLTAEVALLPTIVLLRGASALRFIDERVPGVSVPAETIRRVEQARGEADEAYAVALEQSQHALSLPGVRGLHITDFRHDGAFSRLCHDLGIPSREERQAHAHRAPLSV